MTRIAFLRSIEIQQTDPYLSRLDEAFRTKGIQAKLFYTDGDCGPDDFPGESEKLDPSPSCDDIVRKLLEWRADGVVSISIPDECSLRDAIVKEKLARHGIPMVMHGVETTVRLANKWVTKQTVLDHGLNTPPGILVDGDLLNGRNLPVPAYLDFVERKAEELGFPLLSKPLWDCLANGIRYIGSNADLNEYLREPYDGNVVLERCLAGELCSVEIVGSQGRYVVQPLIWKGRTGGEPSFLFEQLRFSAPRRIADARFRSVAARLTRLCAELEIDGAIEVEMIYSDGDYHIIEINPRVSGSTTLSIAASGLNTYECLLQILLGAWPQEHSHVTGGRRRFAFQFPIVSPDVDLLHDAERELDLVRASSFHIDGKVHANMVITCEFGDEMALGAALESLCARHDFLHPSMLGDIESLLARTAEERVAESAFSPAETAWSTLTSVPA